MSHRTEDPVLCSARREALVVFVTWACALTYTVTYCYFNGYDRSTADLKFVHLFWGIAFPDWIFWGIIIPWAVCFGVSWWFSFVFVRDADLGQELEGDQDVLRDASGGNHA